MSTSSSNIQDEQFEQFQIKGEDNIQHEVRMYQKLGKTYFGDVYYFPKLSNHMVRKDNRICICNKLQGFNETILPELYYGNCKNEINSIFHSICKAVQHMHMKQVEYGFYDLSDIKIIQTQKLKVVKFTNFQYSMDRSSNTNYSQVRRLQYSLLVAPEFYELNNILFCNYKGDIYSLGIIYWMLITKRFYQEDKKNIQDQGINQTNFVQEHLLIKKCCLENPEDRPTIQELIESLEKIQNITPPQHSDKGSKFSFVSSGSNLSESILRNQKNLLLEENNLQKNNLKKLQLLYIWVIQHFQLFHELKMKELHNMMMSHYSNLLIQLQLKNLQEPKYKHLTQMFSKLKKRIQSKRSSFWKFCTNQQQSDLQQDRYDFKNITQQIMKSVKLHIFSKRIPTPILYLLVRGIYEYQKLTNLQQTTKLQNFEKLYSQMMKLQISLASASKIVSKEMELLLINFEKRIKECQK